MSQTFTISQGDTGPDLVESLYEFMADGTTKPVDLTGATNLRFYLYAEDGTEIVDSPATVLQANPAVVSYQWTTADTGTAGTYLRQWTVTMGDGDNVTFPNDVDGYPVLITQVGVTPASARLVQAWCTPADVMRCAPCAGASFDTQTVEDAIAVASDVLYLMSGKLYGLLPDLVRPIRDDQAGWWFPVFGSYSVTYQESYGTVDPTRFRYRDYVNDRRLLAASEIRLPGYPVDSVEQVWIDGVVLDPSEYLLADARWLVRRTGAWPVWQDIRKFSWDADAANTFAVQYVYGAEVPAMGVRAAAAYACQVARAWQPGGAADCQLPPRTQSVVRQGLTVRTLDPQDFTEKGRTGVPEADAFLKAVNPHSLVERAAVFSPDMDWPAVRTRLGIQ